MRDNLGRDETNTKKERLLDGVCKPDDIKGFSYGQIKTLCAEIREEIIGTMAQNGGHLASNLGVVELTVALHRVLNSPEDQLVFDVGHQCYTHKLLTGRRGGFSTIRQAGGLSGYPKPSESPHDPVICGHASSSISSACGLAQAKTLAGDKHFVVAVVGDGALTGGLSFEGLNNAGRCRDRIIVIINDNKMSISRNVGAMARYLAVVRSRSFYIRFKTRLARLLGKIPLIGKPVRAVLFKSKAFVKNAIYKSNMFENMGFMYLGPINGHDQRLLEQSISVATRLNRPVIIHVCTDKGKGYAPAEKKPGVFHGIGRFDVETGEAIASATTFSDIFGETICELAKDDADICAVTAAMKDGTGLKGFADNYRGRFFDCGIAEEHAVTFCGGLAAGGRKPVLAVYSSFLQRGYDQLIHDVAIDGLNVTIAVDRAGVVGEDGETHQGIFDCSMLSGIPGIEVFCPATFDELREFLRRAINESGPAVVRYPRGCEPVMPKSFTPSFGSYDLIGDPDGDALIVTYGRISADAANAATTLCGCGLRASCLKLNKVNPIDEKCVTLAAAFPRIYFFEEGIRQGGIGERFGLRLLESGFSGKYRLRAIDNFVPQATVAQSLKNLGLDKESIIEFIKSDND